jgi:hypothetical protein
VVSAKLDASSRSARVAPRRWISRLTMMSAARIGDTSATSPVFQRMPDSSRPSTIAVAVIATKWVMRPMTNAASARSTIASPVPNPKGRLVTPAVRHTDTNDSTAASVHTCASRRRTGMPRIEARSARSAAARTAVPVSVTLRKKARPPMSSGATTRAIRSLASKNTSPTLKEISNGAGMVRIAGPSPQARGSSNAANPRIWDSPRVATVSCSRGAR